MNLPQCECGAFHALFARFCEACGAQPPRKHGTGRQTTAPMSESEAAAFVAAAIELNEALESTNGKWGVA